MTGFPKSLELLVHQHTPLTQTEVTKGFFSKNAISAFLPSLRPNQTGAVVSELANTVQHRRCGSLAGVSAAETNELHLTTVQHYHTHLILHPKATERSSTGPLCVPVFSQPPCKYYSQTARWFKCDKSSATVRRETKL